MHAKKSWALIWWSSYRSISTNFKFFFFCNLIYLLIHNFFYCYFFLWFFLCLKRKKIFNFDQQKESKFVHFVVSLIFISYFSFLFVFFFIFIDFFLTYLFIYFYFYLSSFILFHFFLGSTKFLTLKKKVWTMKIIMWRSWFSKRKFWKKIIKIFFFCKKKKLIIWWLNST